MYADASIDFEGPPRLPACEAATRIKRRPVHRVRATVNDPIVISSGDDSKPSKDGKGVLTKKAMRDKADQKKARWMDVDSSDDEPRFIPVRDKGKRVAVDSSTDEAHTNARRSTTLTNEQDDYRLPGPSGKRKANDLDGDRPSKKPTSMSDRTLVKGKTYDVDQKGVDCQGRDHGLPLPRDSLFLDSDPDLADSEDELPTFYNAKGIVNFSYW